MSAVDHPSATTFATPPGLATPGVFAPLLLWLILQLLCLAASLAHVPLWANMPLDLDSLALPEVLVVQSAVAALLLPILFRTPLTALLVIASVWPFCQVAAFISSTPISQWITAVIALSGWMAVLALWRALLKTALLQRIGTALAVAVTLGAPLLLYLRAEFSPDPVYTIPWSFAACFGPMLNTLAALQPGISLLASWMVIAAFLVFPATWLLISHLIARHRTHQST